MKRVYTSREYAYRTVAKRYTPEIQRAIGKQYMRVLQRRVLGVVRSKWGFACGSLDACTNSTFPYARSHELVLRGVSEDYCTMMRPDTGLSEKRTAY